MSWHNRPCPQYEVRVETTEVKLTKGWTPPGEPKPVPVPKPPREPLRRAKAWRGMLDEGVYASQSALARGEGVTAAAVSLGLKKLRGEEPTKRGTSGLPRAPGEGPEPAPRR
jgi:hypothetical protein